MLDFEAVGFIELKGFADVLVEVGLAELIWVAFILDDAVDATARLCGCTLAFVVEVVLFAELDLEAVDTTELE